ncbi:ThiF family adenylyltransferase [Staphylococcus edaphicus]|uniref:Molybdopterin biosynthesis protein MoeB n=1 Tax=Staphylococcus edaphicus TaxID=1955013 RepID=A0A2C6WHG8_9STAP|nr:ThiF family adenylyltransferase [Staphylococcus edaphicus]PHK50238.1 molybdopterin biosynthesis protein MoeB [Staphylococcus edaphicus]UQW82164.1 ThiF family adenylyltransferase [Staphylococcus edaphicus]
MAQDRYSRQILFKHIGLDGQDKIMQGHILIIGMGALGTHLAESLVRSGIGELTIVDRDYIEHSNLQRQTLFTEADADAALPKVIAAEKSLLTIRKDLRIHSHIAHVDRQFLEEYGKNISVILDATDNFETRQLINDFAYQQNKPWIYGGVVQSTYIEAAFIPGTTPCFNCMVPQLPMLNMTCDTVGVIQPAVSMTTSLQTRDVLKLLVEQSVDTKVTYGDLWDGTHRQFGFSKLYRTECSTCGTNPTYPYLNETKRQYASLCGRDTVQYDNPNISQEMLAIFLNQHNIAFKRNPYMLQFQYKDYRIVSFKGGRMLIHGMSRPQEAINLMNQLFG